MGNRRRTLDTVTMTRVGDRRFLHARTVQPRTSHQSDTCDGCQKSIPPHTQFIHSDDIPRFSPAGQRYCLACCAVS